MGLKSFLQTLSHPHPTARKEGVFQFMEGKGRNMEGKQKGHLTHGLFLTQITKPLSV